MRTAIAALALMLTTSVQAATFQRVLDNHGENVLLVNGPIVEADAADFEAFAAIIPGSATVVLNSYGGRVVAALAMGKIIHDRKWNTTVAHNTECDSACALIWLAGVNRTIDQNSRVGFHAAYVTDVSGTNLVVAPANAVAGAYMARLGYSDEAIRFATTAAPSGMSYLDSDTINISPIDYEIAGYEPRQKASNTVHQLGHIQAQAQPRQVPTQRILATPLSLAGAVPPSAAIVPSN